MAPSHIRRVEITDLSAVRELMVDLGYEVESAALAATLEALMTNPQTVVLVHESDREVDALLALSFRPQLHRGSLTATIDELVTRRDRRGRGIGHALVDAAIEEAKKRDAARVELSTRRNRASYERRFYDSCGFVESPSALFRMVI